MFFNGPTGWGDQDSNPASRSTTADPRVDETHTVVVNKRTHRVVFGEETEDSVLVVVEPKD